MVTYDRATDFWIRHDRQKSRMSLAEIRAAVIAREDAVTKVENFVRKRHRALRSLEPVPQIPMLTLTATPLFLEEGGVDVAAEGILELVKSPPAFRSRAAGQLGGSYPHAMPTLHGIRHGETVKKRLEVFRTGHMEFASLLHLIYRLPGSSQSLITTWCLAELVRNFAHFAMSIRHVAQISDPYLFGLKFWSVVGLEMFRRVRDSFDDYQPGAYREEPDLTLPLVVSASDDAPDDITRQMLNRFWNAFGYPESPYFGPTGGFVLPENM
jgi:hypothetical protein